MNNLKLNQKKPLYCILVMYTDAHKNYEPNLTLSENA